MLQFWSILEPTWLYFGRVLGAKMGPRWHQIYLKIDLQINQKIDHISDRSWNRFWSILGPKVAPKRGSKLSFFGFFRALGAILGPRWPKTPPRQLCGPILIDFGSIFDWFLMDIWLIFNRSLEVFFWCILIFKNYWMDSGLIFQWYMILETILK